MGNFMDLTGKRFGAWLVLSRDNSRPKITRWLCRCDCGTERVIVSQTLREGTSVSCGCLKGELIAKSKIKHGRAHTKAYQVWGDMIRRCTNERIPNWHNYGGRSIKVCDEWLVFENWNRDMGDPPPGLTLERIDNDGNYEKSNCKWATVQEQNHNTRLERDPVTGRFKAPDAA